MRLIVGLGNPGEKYSSTRHNAGFFVVDHIARSNGATLKFDKNFNADVAKIMYMGEMTVLAKPMAYMNESGGVVSKLLKYYKINSEHLVVIHDELDVPSGEYKISFGKNAAGHKGVQSIIDIIKTNAFLRVRIGLATSSHSNAKKSHGKKAKDEEVSSFVLSQFSKSELKAIDMVTADATDALNKKLSVSRSRAKKVEKG